MSERLEGAIVTIHADQPYLGSYGLMLGDDGQHYVWNAGQFYRNGSYIELGERYSFEVVSYRYATNIDRLHKTLGVSA